MAFGIKRQFLTNGWDGNDVFAPLEYDNKLFIPISNNEGASSKNGCYIKMYNNKSGWSDVSKEPIWTDDLILGKDVKNITKLIKHNDYLRAFTDGDGLYTRNISGNWENTEYPSGVAAYDAISPSGFDSDLYTGISGEYHEDLNIWKIDINDEWTNVKTFESNITGRPTVWAFGSDEDNIYLSIGGYDKGRGIGFTVNDGIWRYDKNTWTHESSMIAQSFAFAFGSMFAGGNDGRIYKRHSNGSWSVKYNTSQEAVISLELILYATLVAGTENGACLFKTRDGNNWKIIENFDTIGSAYISEYHGKAVIVYHYSQNKIHVQYRYRAKE